MHLTILNLSTDTIIASSRSKAKPNTRLPNVVVLPTTSNIINACKRKLTLGQSNREEKSVTLESFAILVSMALGTSWQVIPTLQSCPWRIYCSRVTKKHYKLVILPRRDMSSYLSKLPDTLPLSSLSLPGTHDTMAFYGWPISQCQSLSTPLSTQLWSGIRVLDIRLAIINDKLICFHGVYPQRTPFQNLLETVHSFLTHSLSCHETIVMSIKQEDFARYSWPKFSSLVRQEIEQGPGGIDMWYLKNGIPTLGEVRGKVVMFSRFGGNGKGWDGGLEGLGIHPTTWPDSYKPGFTWECKGTTVNTQDWYAIPSFLSIPEKVVLATKVLLPPESATTTPNLAISFLSAASFPLALPPSVALGFGWPAIGFGVEGVNSRVGNWILELLGKDDEKTKAHEPRIRGWVLMDFFNYPEEDGLVPLLVECNFRGRRVGEEGW